MIPLYVTEFLSSWITIPINTISDIVVFFAASKLQLGRELLKYHYPKLTVMRGVEHSVLLFSNDVVKIPIFNQMCKNLLWLTYLSTSLMINHSGSSEVTSCMSIIYTVTIELMLNGRSQYFLNSNSFSTKYPVHKNIGPPYLVYWWYILYLIKKNKFNWIMYE